jgi:ribonuclease VapC
VTRNHLLDASALLALIFDEPGADRVRELLDDSKIHAVNLAEVVRKMVALGMSAEEVISHIASLNLEVIEGLSATQVYEIARLAAEAKRLGLSVGDCVCLTQAEWYGSAAVTADRTWQEVRGRKVKMVLIR